MKNKLVMIVLGVILVLAAGAMVYAIYSTQSGKEVFAEDGYVLVYDDKDPDQPMKTYHFNEGTSFKRTYEGSVQFKDVDGNIVTADADSFVHYDSGASAPLSKSVLVNLDEVGSSAVNYYGMGSNTSVDRSGSGYSIAAESGNIDLSNFLWKVGENRYMMVSDTLTVSFTDGSEYVFDDYVELIYQDGGMVVIVNGDTMLRDASKNAYVTTDTGISINLNTQMILEEGVPKMALGSITTDSDQVVNVMPADVDTTKVIMPVFEFEVHDGKNGEAGPDGQSGANGIDGDIGADGVSGENGESGRTGLMGYDGDDGEAGQAGTSGRSGINGVEGAEGPDGAPGASGAAGPQGGQGAAGGAGSAGSAGPSGPSGNDGGNGLDGPDGENGGIEQVFNPLDVIKDVPIISWETGPVATFSQISGTFGFRMAVGAQSTTTIKNIVTEIIDVSTGKLAAEPKECQGSKSAAGDGQTLTDLENFAFDNLAPATAYRIKVTGTYKYGTTDVDTVFDDRTLITDDYPLGVNIYSVQKDSIVVELINRDPRLSNGVAAGKYALDYILTKPNGIGFDTVSQNSFVLSENGTRVNDDNTTSDFVTLNGLQPDTLYYFTVTEFQNSRDIPQRYKNIPVKTLKTIPTFSQVRAVSNIINQSFDLSVIDLNDPQHAVTAFRYEFYDEADTTFSNPVKIYRAPDADTVHCYVDDISSGSGFHASGNYRVLAVAEVFDNQKHIELTVPTTGIVSLNGVDKYATVTFENPDCVLANAIGSDSNKARFYIHVPKTMTLQDNTKIRVTYTADGLEDVTRECNVLDPGTGTENEKIYMIEEKFDNLRSKTQYIFTFRGFVNLPTEESAVRNERILGTKLISTPEYARVNAAVQSITSGTSPVTFSVTLTQTSGNDSVFYAGNNSQYAVIQAGNKATVVTALGEEIYQGKVKVQLWTNSTDNPNGLTDQQNPQSGWKEIQGAVKEFDLNYSNQSSSSKTREIVLSDFGNENTLMAALSDYYRVEVIHATDATKYANIINASAFSDRQQINKTYPDPDTLNIYIRPLTKGDISVDYSDHSDDTYYKEYDTDTVIGFEAKVNSGNGEGLLSNALDCFTSVTYYLYDRMYYERNMQPIVDGMLSSGVTTVTKWLSVQEDSGHQETDYFYPNDSGLNHDSNYLAKITIPLSGNAGATKFSRSATFMFEDLNAAVGSNDARANNLKNRNLKIQNNSSVTECIVNGPIDRGHDYIVTCRFEVDTTMGTSAGQMYPEVLKDSNPGKVKVIKSERYVAAPYEAPDYHFYPAYNDNSSITYGYYINTVDANGIFEDLSGTSGENNKKFFIDGGDYKTKTGVSVSSWEMNASGGGATNTIICGQDALVTIGGLTKLDKAELSIKEKLYDSSYGDWGKTNRVVFRRFFYGLTGTPNASFTADSVDDSSTVQFRITCASAEEARSISAIEGIFWKQGDQGEPHSIFLSFDTFTSNIIEAYVPYSKLSSFASTSSLINVKLVAYYDTGKEGFLDTSGGPAYDGSTAQYVSIREAGENNYGQYILLDTENGRLQWRSLTDPRAENSFFLMKTNGNKGGAVKNVKSTYEDDGTVDDVKHGLVAVSFYDGFKKDDSVLIRATSGSAGSQAQLRGVYDSIVASGSNPYYTVSRISSTILAVTGGEGEELQFTLGTVKPQVDFHKGQLDFNISETSDTATVKFKLSGMNGVGDSIFGIDSSATPAVHGKLFLIMAKSLGDDRYEDLKKDEKFWQVDVPLDQGTNGDTPEDSYYSYTFTNLDSNEHYYFRVAYFPADAMEEDLLDPSKRIYVPDARAPMKSADRVYYHIHTSRGMSAVDTTRKITTVYNANGYDNKWLEISMPIVGSGLTSNQQYIAALFDQSNNLVLTHREIEASFKTSNMYGDKSVDFKLYISPEGSDDGLIVGKKNSKDLYINFSGQDGDIHNYKLGIIPVSTLSLVSGYDFNPSEGGTPVSPWTDENDHLSHATAYSDRYKEWLREKSIAGNANDPWDNKVIWVDFRTKVKAQLSDPFIEIQCYPGNQQMNFKVSIIDNDGVIYGNQFMIKATGNKTGNITTAYDNTTRSTQSPLTLNLTELAIEETVTLSVYAVIDKSSVGGNIQTIDTYKEKFATGEEDALITAGKFYKESEEGITTDADGFSMGLVSAVEHENRRDVYIDFVNPLRLDAVTVLTAVIINQNGVYSDQIIVENPFYGSPAQNEYYTMPTEENGDIRYRFKGLANQYDNNGYAFTQSGNYKIALTLTIQRAQGGETYNVNKLLNYYVR